MVRIAVIGCKKRRESPGSMCSDCREDMQERDSQFKRYKSDDKLVAIANTGETKNLIGPDVSDMNQAAEYIACNYDVLHVAKCLPKKKKKGKQTFDFESLAEKLNNEHGKTVVVGKYSYDQWKNKKD